MNYENVFHIYRYHWSIPNLKKIRQKNNMKFIKYFKENCSINDIKSYRYESNLDGTFELFKYLSYFLLLENGFPFTQKKNNYVYSMNKQKYIISKNLFVILIDSIDKDYNEIWDF